MKTIKEAAAALGVCRQRVLDMVHAGQLETRPNPYRTGGILITEAAIAARKRAKERWLKTRRADGSASGDRLTTVGKGVSLETEPSDLKALEERAAQGDASAQFNLGVIYAEGQGVPQDYVQAHKWINLAAAKGTGEDRNKRAKVRRRVAAKMTPAQIAEAQKLAREWKPTPAQPQELPF